LFTLHLSRILESFSTAFFSFAKMIIGGLASLKMFYNLAFFWPSEINSTIYSISFFPPPGSPMLIKQNALRYFFARRSMSEGIVALKR